MTAHDLKMHHGARSTCLSPRFLLIDKFSQCSHVDARCIFSIRFALERERKILNPKSLQAKWKQSHTPPLTPRAQHQQHTGSSLLSHVASPCGTSAARTLTSLLRGLSIATPAGKIGPLLVAIPKHKSAALVLPHTLPDADAPPQTAR